MISVVVIGKNEGERLTACLRSVRDAMRSLSYELLYVDSRSTDDSILRAGKEGAKVYRLTGDETNAGLGRMIGANEAQGEWILFLDGDMELKPGFIEKALLTAEQSHADGICGIRADRYVKDGSVIGYNENYFQCLEPRICQEFGGAIMLSSAMLRKCGNWSPDLIACEEAELHARLLFKHARLLEIPVSFILHTDSVREDRSFLSAVFSRRRLGEGQAVRYAITRHTLRSYLRLKRIQFLFWILDLLSLLLLFFVPVGFPLAMFFQCMQIGYYAKTKGLRAYISQKLFFFALPPGVLSYRHYDPSYEEVSV